MTDCVCLHEWVIDEASDDLSIECEAALADLLRVSDVERHCFFEVVATFTSFEVLLDLGAADWDRATDGVVSFEDWLA